MVDGVDNGVLLQAIHGVLVIAVVIFVVDGMEL